LIAFLKSLFLKDAFYLASEAWQAVKPTKITFCWDKALGNPFKHIEDTPDIEEYIDKIIRSDSNLAGVITIPTDFIH
jgi:hypothetical protein